MKRNISRLLSLLLSVALIASLALAGTSVRAEDGDVEAVTALLEQIDSLQQMQAKRSEWTVSAGYDPVNPDPAVQAEHDAAVEGYAAYVADMNEKRARAQAAYEDLTDDERAELDPDLVAKLTDTLENTFREGPYDLFPQDTEYHYQIVQISERKWLGYELSTHMSVDKDMPCTLIIADTSTDATSITLNGPYSYGTNNYDLTYCCDELQPTTYANHYRRINLEDCTYYNSYQASKIRAIVLSSYPFIPLEEMKANLIAAGVEGAQDLDRSDIVAGVQFAIWHFSNRMTNENLERDTSYGCSGLTLDYPRATARLITSVNDYRNELWYWYSSKPSQMTYHEDINKRVMALREYLMGLPGVEAGEGSIVISSVKIVRTDLVPNTDDTYTLSLNVLLNHGAGENDTITLSVTTSSVDDEGEVHVTATETVDVTGETSYPLTINARYGDTVHVEVKGNQELSKAVYFYEPEGGYEASQSLVGVAEGSTKVRAENQFRFDKDIEAGLRIYKTEKDTGNPMQGIVFDVYRVTPDEGETLSETPTEEEIARFAVDENKVASIATDESGYAAVELPEGLYLLIEEHDPTKSKAPIVPMYFTLPVETEQQNEDGTIDVTYGPVYSCKLVNEPPDEPGSVSFKPAVTKEINDWGDAESFTFKLEAVTDGAPMPDSDTAVATRENPLAEFGSITFYEEGVYEYTITEVDDGVAFVTYDTEPHALTVTVTEVPDTMHQQFEIEVSYDGEESLTITNRYEVVPVDVELQVTKEINDWGDAESFTFKLEAVTDGAPMPDSDTAVATREDPLAVFGAISFDAEGVYEYTITEVDDGVLFVTYDTEPHAVTVTVTKGEDGFEVEVSYDGEESLTVTNRYEVIPVEAEIRLTKEINDWGDAESFTFKLEAVTEDAPMPESDTAVATREDPVAVFGAISFDTEGVYEYTITEVDDGVLFVTYDTEPHSLVITVTKGEDGLVATATYDGEDELTIVNRYEVIPVEAEIKVTKAINNWGDAWTFTFDLAAVTEDAPMPESTTATATKADPLAVFGTISFDAEGTYEYTLTERDDGIEHVTYDTEPHAVVITVIKGKDGLEATVTYDGEADLTITNTYVPDTGDGSGMFLYAALCAFCAAALVLLRKRGFVG